MTRPISIAQSLSARSLVSRYILQCAQATSPLAPSRPSRRRALSSSDDDGDDDSDSDDVDDDDDALAPPPPLALLSINHIQKDLSDPSALVRAHALRTLGSLASGQGGGAGLSMSGELDELLVRALVRAARDSAWFVRREAGDAAARFFHAVQARRTRTTSTSRGRRDGVIEVDDEQDEERGGTLDELRAVVLTLARNATPLTLGSAIRAWRATTTSSSSSSSSSAVGQDAHAFVRHWIALVPDADEWSQIEALDFLTLYARRFLPPPRTATITKSSTTEAEDEEEEMDIDLGAIIGAAENLTLHLNSAVVLSATRTVYVLSSPPTNKSARTNKRLRRFVLEPLLNVLSFSGSPNGSLGDNVQAPALAALLVVAHEQPQLFTLAELARSFVHLSPPPPPASPATKKRATAGTDSDGDDDGQAGIRRAKLRVLLACADHAAKTLAVAAAHTNGATSATPTSENERENRQQQAVVEFALGEFERAGDDADVGCREISTHALGLLARRSTDARDRVLGTLMRRMTGAFLLPLLPSRRGCVSQ